MSQGLNEPCVTQWGSCRNGKRPSASTPLVQGDQMLYSKFGTQIFDVSAVTFIYIESCTNLMNAVLILRACVRFKSGRLLSNVQR